VKSKYSASISSSYNFIPIFLQTLRFESPKDKKHFSAVQIDAEHGVHPEAMPPARAVLTFPALR